MDGPPIAQDGQLIGVYSTWDILSPLQSPPPPLPLQAPQGVIFFRGLQYLERGGSNLPGRLPPSLAGGRQMKSGNPAIPRTVPRLGAHRPPDHGAGHIRVVADRHLHLLAAFPDLGRGQTNPW